MGLFILIVIIAVILVAIIALAHYNLLGKRIDTAVDNAVTKLETTIKNVK